MQFSSHALMRSTMILSEQNLSKFNHLNYFFINFIRAACEIASHQMCYKFLSHQLKVNINKKLGRSIFTFASEFLAINFTKIFRFDYNKSQYKSKRI